MRVLLLTDDRACRERAREESLEALSSLEYARRYAPALLDLLACPAAPEPQPPGPAAAAPEQEAQRRVWRRAQAYPEHASAAELQQGVREGRLLQGVLHVSRDFPLEAYVSLRPAGRDSDSRLAEEVLVQGRLHMNRATDGDLVAIELLPEQQWARPSERVLEEDDEALLAAEQRDADEEEGPGAGASAGGGEAARMAEERARAEERATRAARVRSGRVVGILRRRWHHMPGMLLPAPRLRDQAPGSGERCLLRPLDRRFPLVELRLADPAGLLSELLVVQMDEWEAGARFPRGHLVRRLGAAGDTEAETEALLVAFEVPHEDWAPSALRCLPTLPYSIPLQEERRRLDLRGLQTLCSIDPPGCVDIDDALHLRRLGPGVVEVGVHIADVSAFLEHGSTLDLEAARRATTVYLANRRINMLPELLSEDLCSLREGVDRLAFSVIWELEEATARVLSARFARTLIRSVRSFSYAEAQACIEDASRQDELTRALRMLNELARRLKAQRLAAGALQLASPEVRFVRDPGDPRGFGGDPIDVELYPHQETHSLVEEFMLLANVEAARRILEHYPTLALLRRHPPPSPARLAQLARHLERRGFRLDASSSRALADSLDRIEDPREPYLNTLVRILVTRCMSQAVYFCAGAVHPADYPHYGLAAPVYTHFTSPIRRYADVIVHRLLAGTIGDSPPPLDKAQVVRLAENINYRHRMAQTADRQSTELFTVRFFQAKGRPVREDGYVTQVRENALSVLVPRYGIEGTLYLPLHNDDAERGSLYAFDEELATVRFRGREYTLFQRLPLEISTEPIPGSHKHRLRLSCPLFHEPPPSPSPSAPAAATTAAPTSSPPSPPPIPPATTGPADVPMVDADGTGSGGEAQKKKKKKKKKKPQEQAGAAESPAKRPRTDP
jgi:exosome complex exonuclease DIS3/RRP44